MQADGSGEVYAGNGIKVLARVALLTVVNGSVFCFQAADGQSKVCPRPTAAESGWDAGGPCGCTVDEEPGNVPRLLLVPG